MAVTLWGVVCRHACGFLGAWSFLILGAISSVIVLADPAFEHRLYLPLAAVVALVVLAVRAAGGVLVGCALVSRATARRAGFGLLAAACVVLGGLTCWRNTDYFSPEQLMRDTVQQSPRMPCAQYNLGTIYVEQGKTEAAVECYDLAIKANPHYAPAHNNLGVIR